MQYQFSKFLFVAFLCFISLKEVIAQDNNRYKKLQHSFNKTSNQISEQLETLEGILRPLDYNRLYNAHKELQEDLSIIFAKDIIYSNDFITSMECHENTLSKLVDSALKEEIVDHDYNYAIQSYNDIAIKASYLSKNNDNDLVTVEVHTVDFNSGNKVEHCIVSYRPYYMCNPSKVRRFDNLSTPTTHDIPPSRWLIWAVKKENSSSSSLFPSYFSSFDIGDDGKSFRKISIFCKSQINP